MAVKLTTKDALLNAAGICKQSKLDELSELINTAAFSARMLERVNYEDIFMVNQTDTYERLRRNTAALATLLRMSLDAAECIKSEINTIFAALDTAEKDKVHRQKQALALEIERQKNKARNERAKQSKSCADSQ